MDGLYVAEGYPVLGNCSDDRDCPSASVCYLEPTWTDLRRFCTCHTRNGFQGEQCDETSIQTVFLICLQLIPMLISIVLWFLNLYDMVSYVLIKETRYKVNATLSTSVMLNGALLTFSLWRVSEIIILMSPQNLVLRGESKFNESFWFQETMIVLSVSLSTLALLNVSLMWLEVFHRATKMKARSYSNLRRYRLVILVFEATYVGFVVIMTLLEMYEFMIIASAPFFLFIGLTYFVGGRRMCNLINSTLCEAMFKSKYTDMLRQIAQTARRIVFSIAAVLTIGIAVAVLQSGGEAWRKRTQPGWSKWPEYVNVSVQYVMLYILYALRLYVHQNIHNVIGRWKDGSSDAPSNRSFWKMGNGKGRFEGDKSFQEPMVSMSVDGPQNSLNRVLGNPEELKKFRAYCKKKHGLENLKCLLAIKDYEDRALNTPNWNKQQETARNIVEEYLLEGSKNSITCGDEFVLQVLKIHDNTDGTLEYQPDSFRTIEEELLVLIRENFYRPYLKEQELEEKQKQIKYKNEFKEYV